MIADRRTWALVSAWTLWAASAFVLPAYPVWPGIAWTVLPGVVALLWPAGRRRWYRWPVAWTLFVLTVPAFAIPVALTATAWIALRTLHEARDMATDGNQTAGIEARRARIG